MPKREGWSIDTEAGRALSESDDHVNVSPSEFPVAGSSYKLILVSKPCESRRSEWLLM